MPRWKPFAEQSALEHHWVAFSLRSGLHLVSLHSLETLRITNGVRERVHPPVTPEQRRWFWTDTCNAATLTEDATLYVVDNVGAVWRRAVDQGLEALTPTGIAAHPEPGPRSSRHHTALAFEPVSRTLVIAGGQSRTDSYMLAAGRTEAEAIATPRLTKGDACAFASELRVWHFAAGALSELVARRWKRVATRRSTGAQALLRDPLRDRWLHLEVAPRAPSTFELRVLSASRLGPAVTLEGELLHALERRAGAVIAYDPLLDALVHVEGTRTMAMSVADCLG